MTNIGMHTYLGCLFCLSLASFSVSAQATTCWSSWINDNHPDDTKNRTDKEMIPVRNKFPASCQVDPKPEVRVQCKDENGEPFTGSSDKSSSHYTFTCDNKQGLTCKPFPDYVAKNYTCPDLSMQVGCDCPVQSVTGKSSVVQTSTPAATTRAGSSTAQTAAHGNNGGGAVAASLVLHVLQVTLVLALAAW